MGKKNYDDLADFCGPKEFYDVDGDGHIDDFEASMMLADVQEELDEFERDSNHSSPPPPQAKQRSGCLVRLCWYIFFGFLWAMFCKIMGWD